jgi:uncharacterized protein (DUF2384 family)
MARAWSSVIERLEPAENPGVLLDVRPLLRRLVTAYGQSTVARFLAVDRSMVNHWIRNDRAISPAMSARIFDVHEVVCRVHQVFNPVLAARWLVGSEPLLGDARPIDVLGIFGATPVIEALESIAAGGFA